MIDTIDIAYSPSCEIDKEILNAAILFAMNSTDEFACNGVSKEDVIDWLKSFKDRVQSQPKQEWSEEDMEMIRTLVAIFEVNYPNGFYKVNPIGTTNMQGIHSSEIIKWLKSLKNKVQLKVE